MNEAGVLALIGELYEQLRSQAAEIERLKQSQDARSTQSEAFDPVAGPEEAIAQARKESEAKD